MGEWSNKKSVSQRWHFHRRWPFAPFTNLIGVQYAAELLLLMQVGMIDYTPSRSSSFIALATSRSRLATVCVGGTSAASPRVSRRKNRAMAPLSRCIACRRPEPIRDLRHGSPRWSTCKCTKNVWPLASTSAAEDAAPLQTVKSEFRCWGRSSSTFHVKADLPTHAMVGEGPGEQSTGDRTGDSGDTFTGQTVLFSFLVFLRPVHGLPPCTL